MVATQPRPITLQVDLTPLYPFIEKEKELSKEELLQRTAGKIEYPIIQLLKQIEFYSINKNEDGSLYLL